MSDKRKHPASAIAAEARQEAVNKAWRMLRREHGIDDAPDEIWIGPGWFGLLDETIAKLIAAGWDRKVAEIKQKFCALRFYVGGRDDNAIRAILLDAERRSVTMCEHCGEPHKLKRLMGVALCEACEDVSLNRPITNPYFMRAQIAERIAKWRQRR